MKRVILLVFIATLAGCDQAADTGMPEPQDSTAGSANVADTEQPGGSSETPDGQSEGPRAHVFQFGLYKAIRKGKVGTSTETNTGKVVRKPKLEHVSMTDRIPLVKDTYFGYQYRLFKLPPEALVKPFIELRKVLVHPEMTLPDGSRTTGWDRTFKGRVETQQVMGFDGYAFNEDYELVEGDWIFQIWYQDKKLIERKFVSVQPQQAQAAKESDKE